MTCSECGDSYVYYSGLEECDDGNTVGGDGCDAECLAEPGWTCSPIECDCLGPTTCTFSCLLGYNTETT